MMADGFCSNWIGHELPPLEVVRLCKRILRQTHQEFIGSSEVKPVAEHRKALHLGDCLLYVACIMEEDSVSLSDGSGSCLGPGARSPL